MAISSSQLCFLVAIIALFLIHPSESYRYPKSLFIFGDSIYDPGNNNFINTTTLLQANFIPYGETFFNYPTGRFSDGRLIPDFIAEFAKLPFIRPYLQPKNNHRLPYYGLNFASGGAGALSETFSGLAIDLKMQLNYFKKVASELRSKLGEKGSKSLLSNAIYMFSIGNNDYLFPFSSNSSAIKDHGPQQFAQMVIGNFTYVIEEIYKTGGRKFGLVNIPQLGCTPGLRIINNGECVEEMTALAKLHNVLFNEKINEIKKKLHGFHYSLFDFFGISAEIKNNPSKFGFKEVKSACCGSGPLRGINSCGGKRGVEEFELCNNVDEYFFFDSNHPTESAYRQLANIMWNGDEKFTGPYNLKSLFEITF